MNTPCFSGWDLPRTSGVSLRGPWGLPVVFEGPTRGSERLLSATPGRWAQGSDDLEIHPCGRNPIRVMKHGMELGVWSWWDIHPREGCRVTQMHFLMRTSSLLLFRRYFHGDVIEF